MKKFKRILPIVLSLILIFSSMSITAFAAVPSTGDALIDDFVAEVYELDATEREMFVDLLMLFKNISNTGRSGLTTAYTNAFGLLTAEQSRLEAFGATTTAFSQFATYVNTSTFTEASLRSYLGLDGSEDRDGFVAEMVVIKDSFGPLLASTLDTSKLDIGFNNLKRVFLIMNNPLFNTEVYDATEVNGTLIVNSTRVGNLVDIANGLIGRDITDTASVVCAFGALNNFYANASSTDKAKIYSYLNTNGIIKLTPPVNDNTGGTGSGTTPPPPAEEVVTTPTLQDQVEQEATVQVPATVIQTGNEITLTSNVTSTTLTSALQTAKEAVAKVVATAPAAEAKKVATVVVLEVPKQEGKAATATQVSLPVSALKEVETAGAQGVTVKSELGQVTFDTTSILTAAQGTAVPETINLEIKTVKEADLVGVNVPAGAVVLNFSIKVNDTEVREFSKPLTIKVPYTLKQGENAEQITIYFLNENGVSEPVGGRFNAQTGMVEFLTNHFSKYYASIATKSFADIASDFWAKTYIENLGAKGFINGRTSTTFAPQDNITRAEFVAIVSRMYKLIGNTDILKFDDVKSTDWFAKDVAAAYQAGIIGGRTDTSFDPNSPITRQEMAVVIANTLSYLGYEKADSYTLTGTFVDAEQVSSWAKDAVARSYNKNIVGGKPGQIFDPLAKATRAETAKMLYVLYYLQ